MLRDMISTFKWILLKNDSAYAWTTMVNQTDLNTRVKCERYYKKIAGRIEYEHDADNVDAVVQQVAYMFDLVEKSALAIYKNNVSRLCSHQIGFLVASVLFCVNAAVLRLSNSLIAGFLLLCAGLIAYALTQMRVSADKVLIDKGYSTRKAGYIARQMCALGYNVKISDDTD